jgi:hypothetical protein
MQPYISDAERERARWMTLAELIAHTAKHHGRRSALKQIRGALDDRKLIAKWEDATADQLRRKLPTDPPPMTDADGPPQGPTLLPDWPPNKTSFWQQARIRGSKVFDPETECWRTLLLLRWSVQQSWPEQQPVPPPPENSKGGAPSKRDKIWEKLSGVDLTNVTNAIRLVRERWSDNDGKFPHDKTIRRWALVLRDKTEKT